LAFGLSSLGVEQAMGACPRPRLQPPDAGAGQGPSM